MSNLEPIIIYSKPIQSIEAPLFMALNKDYAGSYLKHDVYVHLSRDNNHLYFSTKSDFFGQAIPKDLGTKEGLWESMVSELFIYDQEKGSYQEFNISPTGYHWGMNFLRYRERSGPIMGLEYKSDSDLFILKIPLNSININLESKYCCVQIAGVINPSKDKPILYSSSSINTEIPDFHNIKAGSKIKFLKI